MSSLFASFLQSIPYKTRSELVNDLELPDDITVAPYVLSDIDYFSSDNLVSAVPLYSPVLEDDGSFSSDSSLSLSRAMTDSDIDYERFSSNFQILCPLHFDACPELRNIPFTDPWNDMRTALDSFPSGYVSSLDNYMFSSYPTGTLYETYEKAKKGWLHDAELQSRMEKFFDEECRVYSPDDPGLLTLEEALQDIDYRMIDLEDLAY